MLSALHTWTLTAISVAAGVAMLWIFGRFSDQARIEVAKRKLHAHLLAFRLFADEPRLIFRAQRELLVWNARYLALMLRPTLVMILPLAALLWQLDAVYGRRALSPGESAIVTAQLAAKTDAATASPSLNGRGVAVETPPLRLADSHQVMWRVRPAASGVSSPEVVMQLNSARWGKAIQTGAGLAYLPQHYVVSWLAWLGYPAEWGLTQAQVEWIDVEYPYADVSVFGFGMHWLIWFCIVSMFTMLALRKRFGVTF